ncbi:unnamed protein product [Rangifer tarandus platyrhynchus]|uniref:Uncharacterized protein n=2 Tax=Rangifer tarandus platyrhynchus TaxID=3082113 RepID=A0ACB0DUH7_RANTA|nr:unnamed protein product [Rangifer tarandus platyrhynchus]CAI9691891.1 unnamed protein product [Rangifer tarandus platyrhynchus]
MEKQGYKENKSLRSNLPRKIPHPEPAGRGNALVPAARTRMTARGQACAVERPGRTRRAAPRLPRAGRGPGVEEAPNLAAQGSKPRCKLILSSTLRELSAALLVYR